MPRYYRGIAPGSVLHTVDLRTGMSARSAAAAPSVTAIIDHVAKSATMSPYISFSRSYGIAASYARPSPAVAGTGGPPGYVYAIDIPDKSFLRRLGIQLIDPVVEIADAVNDPVADPSYHHNGEPDFIHGVADPGGVGAVVLYRPALQPPGASAAGPPKLTDHFTALVRALRDAEILVLRNVPANCIVPTRYDVT